METVARETRRFTVDELRRMVDAGIVGADEPLELLDGELVRVLAPRSPEHANTVVRLRALLESAIGSPGSVREEKPLDCGPQNLPEPDLVVLDPALASAHLGEGRHPRGDEALLVVEVAVTSAPVDARKAAVYAAAGVPVYWILDVPGATIVEHRGPRPGGYSTVRRADTATPPGATRPVAALEATG